MSGLLLRKALRDLWLHRARTLLVVAAIAVALAGAGTVLVAWAMVRAATTEGYRASLPVSATLTLDRVDAALLDAVRAMPGIAAARARRTLRASARIDGTARTAVLFALSDPLDRTIARLEPDGGDWPPRPGGLVVERSSVAFASAQTGAAIELAGPDGDAVVVPVDGVVRDVSLAPGWMEHVVYAYVDPALLERLGAPAGFDELQLRVRDARADRAAVRRVAAQVAAAARARGYRVARVHVPPPGEHVHAAQMNSLLLTQGAFAVLALVVCAFLAVNLVTAMLAGEARAIGVLKALGASPRAIGMHYLGHAAAIGIVATLLALPAAALLGRRYGALKLDLLNFPADRVALPLAALALLAAVGVLVPVAAAILPVRRAARLPVAAVLREDRIEASALGTRGIRLPGRELLPNPSRWALDNAFRRPRRTALVVLALALGGAVYLGASNLREAVRGSVDRVFASTRYDLALSWPAAPPADAVESIVSATGGIDAAESWLRAVATVEGDDGLATEDLALVGIAADSALYAPKLLEGRALRAGDARALLVNRTVLRDADAALGSSLTLRIGDRSERWTIVGVVEGAPQPQAVALRHAVDAAAAGSASPVLVVRSARRDLPGQLDLIMRLRAGFDEAGWPVGRSARPDESRRVIEDHLLMVVDFLGAMAWIMVLVGGMGLASTMGIAVLERVREVGVLRALGARHGTLLALVQLESLVLSSAAFVLALPLSVLASRLLGDAFGRVMFSVAPSLLPAADATLRWLALSLVVGLLAAAAPGLRAVRIPVAHAVRQA